MDYSVRKSTPQIDLGATISMQGRGQVPRKTWLTRVFTQPRPEADMVQPDGSYPHPHLRAVQSTYAFNNREPSMRLLSVVLAAMLATSPFIVQAKGSGKGGGSRPSYGGSKHTDSHGGHYQGGSGKSHKGGEYRNNRTGNQYGKHQ